MSQLEAAKRLVSLLEDPHPGLASWNLLVWGGLEGPEVGDGEVRIGG